MTMNWDWQWQAEVSAISVNGQLFVTCCAKFKSDGYLFRGQQFSSLGSQYTMNHGVGPLTFLCVCIGLRAMQVKDPITSIVM